MTMVSPPAEMIVPNTGSIISNSQEQSEKDNSTEKVSNLKNDSNFQKNVMPPGSAAAVPPPPPQGSPPLNKSKTVSELMTPRSNRKLESRLSPILAARRERLSNLETSTKKDRRVSFSNQPVNRWADYAATCDDCMSTRSSSPTFDHGPVSARGYLERHRMSMPGPPREFEFRPDPGRLSQISSSSASSSNQLRPIREATSPVRQTNRRYSMPTRSQSCTNLREDNRNNKSQGPRINMAPIEEEDEEDRGKKQMNSAGGWNFVRNFGFATSFVKDVGKEIASIGSEISTEVRQGASAIGSKLTSAKSEISQGASSFLDKADKMISDALLAEEKNTRPVIIQFDVILVRTRPSDRLGLGVTWVRQSDSSEKGNLIIEKVAPELMLDHWNRVVGRPGPVPVKLVSSKGGPPKRTTSTNLRISKGDVIVAVDGELISNAPDKQSALQKLRRWGQGQKTVITIQKKIEINERKIARRGNPAPNPNAPANRQQQTK